MTYGISLIDQLAVIRNKGHNGNNEHNEYWCVYMDQDNYYKQAEFIITAMKI